MSEWPRVEEQELLDRLAMDERQFEDYLQALTANFPDRTYEVEFFERAIGYPWARPVGSYLLARSGVQLLADLSPGEHEQALDQFTSDRSGRLPLLAIGSNAAPETLERKFAHFPDEDDRAVLALAGFLHDFDIGVAAQPTVYGSMPATPFPSSGTEVSATILWVTPNQFTQLTWSELTYRLGKLRTRFDVNGMDTSFDEVLLFVSRFGTFCADGSPFALAAIPARGRTAAVLTQEQLLDTAAELAIGPDATAESLVRAIFEDLGSITPKIVETVRKASEPFASERWTPFSPDPP